MEPNDSSTTGAPAPLPGQEQVYAVPAEPRPVMGPYLSVLLYLVGYLVVMMVVAVALAIGIGILVGFGAIEMPFADEELMGIGLTDTGELLKLLEPYLLYVLIATFIYSVGYTWAFSRVVDRRRLAHWGLHLRSGWLGQFAIGAALAFLIVAILVAFDLVTGAIRIEGFAHAAPEDGNAFLYLLGVLVAFVMVGVYEELMFRGYVLQRLNERASRWGAIIVSSLVFAVFHGLNPDSGPLAIINITLVGVVLCALYFRSGSLWTPIGFHTSWNFSLGYLFSRPVSGIPLHGILNVVEVDPESGLTGGTFGPEAALATTIAMVLALVGVVLIWRQTGRGPTEGPLS